jgi:hyperosmotically inducible protein
MMILSNRLGSAARLPRARLARCVVLVVLGALAGCGDPERSVASREAVQQADDRLIVRTLDTLLAADPFMRGGTIVADSDGGHVHLAGHVDEHAQIDRALALAFGVAGVRRIEHSLAVRGAAAQAAAAETDRTVGTRVRAMLLADAEVKGFDIDVKTIGGAVLLSGGVARQSQIDRAVQIARVTTGVRSVSHNLRVAR